MTFTDCINIYVVSGKGGNGITSFCRRKFVPKGGPDGGNGGNGGSVLLKGSDNINDFYHLRFTDIYKAGNGCDGRKNRKTGKNGKNIELLVPFGTEVFDNDTGFFLGDISKNNKSLLLAKGGNGGFGNSCFKSGRNVIPTKNTLGLVPEVKFLRLELKLSADVGLLGYPNVGKSSFINIISNTKSKVSDYKFTTTFPILGKSNFNSFNNFAIIDVPGVIENASKGVGLGFSFLKHLLKCRILLHFVDLSKVFNIDDLFKEIVVINNELSSFDCYFNSKEKWLVFNKIDIANNILDYNLIHLKLKEFGYRNIFYISCKDKIGLKKICYYMNGVL